MTDNGKVMQWLETCVGGCEEGCPYEYKNLVFRVECKADLMRDALAILKEQEPIKPTLSVDTWEGAPTVGGWISVNDRLPEEENACLAVDNECRIVIARYKSSNNCSVGWYSAMVYSPPITHWMPLPKPPKEEHDDS